MEGKRGFTLIEVTVSVVLISLIFLGLGVVYVFGIEAWATTTRKLNVQQAGTEILDELTRAAQNATHLQVAPNRLTVETESGDSTKTVEYACEGGACFKKDESGRTVPWIPAYDHDSLAVQNGFEDAIFRFNVDGDDLLHICFLVQGLSGRFSEAMMFRTKVYPRNI